MPDVLLQVKELRTYFDTAQGTIRAVDGISYEVRRGETVTLVGESGCGKSVSALSLLKLVPYPGRIVGGEVILEGQDLLKVPEKEMKRIRGRQMAMIFQEPMTSLNPVMTIGEQIAEPVRVHLRMEHKAARQRVIELLQSVGISDAERRYHDYPHNFSGGMRQRVMIAMALSCDPKILIADEPTTALDVTIQAQLLDLMTDLAHRLDTAVILITHNLGIVARYADKVNVMYAGRIVESGSGDSVYESPRHPYTLGLLQCVPRTDKGKTGKLSPIEGLPPDLSKELIGCYFQPRCPYFISRCLKEYPPLESRGDAHWYACFNPRSL
ncbi:MAG: ABC transporter ATP-binding protein [Chloroflexi bacterium]|nr:ABC transporter ATP-binding protein [Chloroflexota bacterium]